MANHRKIFLLLLSLLPVQLGFHFWPSWSLVLGRRIDYLSPTIYLTDVLIILLLLFWRIPKKNIYYVIPIIFFAAINIWFSISKPVAVYAWIKVIEYFFLGQYIFFTKPKFNDVLFFLSVGVLWSSIIAIIQFLLQHSIGGPLWILGERRFTIDTPGIARFFLDRLILRPYATFPHPNVLGGYIALLLPFIVEKIHRRFYLVVFLFAFAALMLSFSRSAWLIAAFGVGIHTWKSYNKYLVIIVLLGLFVFFRPLFGDESFVVRMQLNQQAIALWQQSRIFGIGLGNFVVRHLQPVHNIYFLILSETGIAGILFLLFFVRKISHFLLLIPLFVLGFFDHYLLTLQQGQLLFTIILVQLAHVEKNSHQHWFSDHR